MKILEIEKEQFLKPLQTVAGIVERRHTLPILSNILLEIKGSNLRLLATDLEIQVATNLTLPKAYPDQAITASARKLLDILRALPDKTSVSLDAGESKLQVKAGKSRFNLQTLPAQDFPTMANSGGAGTGFSLPQRQFRKLLSLVQYGMAQQDIRYYLNGLLLVAEESQLVLVATDGHRLAYASCPMAARQEKAEVIVPRKAVLEVAKLLGDSEDDVRIDLLPGQVRFSFSGVSLISKTIDGKFPDYTRVIPVDHRKNFVLDRLELQQALQRASILSNDKFRGVRWVLSPDCLKIVCTNAENEEAEEELEIAYNGEALDIGFNITYLLDVLANIDTARINCAMGDANSSMLMTIPEDQKFKYVVMPMRI